MERENSSGYRRSLLSRSLTRQCTRAANSGVFTWQISRRGRVILVVRRAQMECLNQLNEMTAEPDMFEGCGNGTLHIAVVHDPAQWSEDAGDRDIRICFNSDDWESVFLKSLHCPVREPYSQGEDVNDWKERNRICFQRAIPQFPMLGRIFDMYEDYLFTPSEVEQLRAECLKAKAVALNPRANLGLRKMIHACEVASKDGFHLLLSCD